MDGTVVSGFSLSGLVDSATSWSVDSLVSGLIGVLFSSSDGVLHWMGMVLNVEPEILSFDSPGAVKVKVFPFQKAPT